MERTCTLRVIRHKWTVFIHQWFKLFATFNLLSNRKSVCKWNWLIEEHYIACFEGPMTLCVLAVILWGHNPKTDISVYGSEGVKHVTATYDPPPPHWWRIVYKNPVHYLLLQLCKGSLSFSVIHCFPNSGVFACGNKMIFIALQSCLPINNHTIVKVMNARVCTLQNNMNMGSKVLILALELS